MKYNRILSTILAFVMMLGCFSVFFGMSAFADTATVADGGDKKSNLELILEEALAQKYGSPESKVLSDKNMSVMAATPTRQIFCNPYTGEVYFRDAQTGQLLGSNPYDLTNYNNIDSEQLALIDSISLPQLMSQVVINYTDNTGTSSSFYSFTEAIQRGQIQVKSINSGIRVEYTMGRLNTLFLLPHWISCGDAPFGWLEKAVTPGGYTYSAGEYDPSTDAENDFYVYLIEPMLAYRDQFEGEEAYDDIQHNIDKIVIWLGTWKDRESAENQKVYECLKNGEFNLHAIDENNLSSGRQLMLEAIIKTYAPKFNYDTLAVIHEKTGFVQKTEVSPLFRLAVEYTINDDGSFGIRVPGNSIRYDETNFTINSIQLLPYMGSLNSLSSGGYIFYPDGSGTLVTYDNLYKNSVNISAPVYGHDHSYYTLSGNINEPITMPVFGAVQTLYYHNSKTNGTADAISNVIFSDPKRALEYVNKDVMSAYDSKIITKQQGYVVVVEEGESMMTFTAQSHGATHSYVGLFSSFNPRPKDTYDLADSISVSGNTEWTVASANKFDGNFKYRVYLLNEDSVAAENSLENYYSTTWVGMAQAYRDYLVSKGIIEEIKANEVKSSLPLYIETFGSIETTTKFLSIPITSNVPLTKFEDVSKMRDELATMGIDNTNFKLSGYYNGGLSGYYPSKIKWMRATGGEGGLEDLLKYADEKDFGIFVDFDFSYTDNDGISFRKNATKTVDGKYSNQKVYSPVYQEYISYFDVCVNANSINKYVNKISEKYSELNEYNSSLGISVSTLGGTLNSDFNEDAPMDREEAKDVIVSALNTLQKTYPGSVMSSTGNAYVLKYVDHLLEVSVDSNHRSAASYTVPFTGMILHGYVSFAGDAVNESGDPNYQILKAIENGACLYYILSYNSTNIMHLKEDPDLNQYYSVRYDIWKDKVKEHYDALNGAIGDLQLHKITDHDFLNVERVLDLVDLRTRNELLVNEMVSKLESTIIALYNQKRDELGAQFGTPGFSVEEIEIMIDADAIYSQAYSVLTANLCRHLEGKEGFAAREAELKAELGLSNGLSASVKARLDAVINKYNTDGAVAGDFTVEVNAIKSVSSNGAITDYAPNYNVTDADSTTDYKPTKYTVADGSVVMVTYSDGKTDVRFIINYNLYDVIATIDGRRVEISSYGFVRL